jgi:hypothetical protein
MILVVTPHLAAGECAETLRAATNEEIVVADSLRQAATLLRTDSYLAVVLDQFMMETEPDEAETVMRHLGTAMPIHVNLAISGWARLAREVRAAVQRRRREEAAARRSAVTTLQCELNGTVTALLLSCELALGAPGLPTAAAERLESTHQLVKKLRSQLESAMVEV